jgi:hypothetical protein
MGFMRNTQSGGHVPNSAAIPLPAGSFMLTQAIDPKKFSDIARGFSEGRKAFSP